jgi:mRNA degradation ribonuclease J1/J2
VTAIAPYDRRAGKTIGQPRIVTQGFVNAPNAEHLSSQAAELIRSTAAARRGTAPGKVEKTIERALSGLFYRETRQKPVVTVALVDVQSK